MIGQPSGNRIKSTPVKLLNSNELSSAVHVQIKRPVADSHYFGLLIGIVSEFVSAIRGAQCLFAHAVFGFFFCFVFGFVITLRIKNVRIRTSQIKAPKRKALTKNHEHER